MKKQNIFTGLRDFLILWSSQAVSTLGTAMTGFALIIWVYEQKGTASSITMLSICSLVPSILFSFVAGTLADRWDKKRIMLLADAVAAAGTMTVLALYTTNSFTFTTSADGCFRHGKRRRHRGDIFHCRRYRKRNKFHVFEKSNIQKSGLNKSDKMQGRLL